MNNKLTITIMTLQDWIELGYSKAEAQALVAQHRADTRYEDRAHRFYYTYTN